MIWRGCVERSAEEETGERWQAEVTSFVALVAASIRETT